MPRAEPWRYEKLTWPEINDAIAVERVVVCPVGSTEQHGPHLPLDVDVVCPCGIAAAAARRIPEEVLVMPPFVHGYAARRPPRGGAEHADAVGSGRGAGRPRWRARRPGRSMTLAGSRCGQ